jgi:hypothetical protein
MAQSGWSGMAEASPVVAAILSLSLIGIPFVMGTWIWGMADAYKSARKWNEAHGIIS